MLVHIFSITLLVFLACVQSHADILFIDLNHSEAEYQTILAEAKKKNEKVIRLPAVDEKKYQIWDSATKEMRKINTLSWEDQKNYTSQYALLSKQAQENAPDYWGYEDFRKAVAKAQKENVQMNTVIISGHHVANSEYEQYAGDLANFDKNFLVSLKREFPQALSKIEHMLLMGCYSYTSKDKGSWDSVAGRSVSVIGFDTPAPLGCSPLSSQIIKKGLQGRDALKKMQTPEEIVKFIGDFNLKPGSCGLTASFGNIYATSRRTNKSIGSLRKCDTALFNDVHKGYVEFQSYLAAQKAGFEDLPANLSDSKMRKTYTLLQQNYDCALLKPFFKDMLKIPFLLHSQDMRVNADNKYGELINQMNEELRPYGFDPIPALDDPKIKRSQLIFHINRIQKIAEKLALKSNSKSSLTQLNWLHRNLKALLIDLDTRDFSWAIPDRDPSILSDPIPRSAPATGSSQHKKAVRY